MKKSMTKLSLSVLAVAVFAVMFWGSTSSKSMINTVQFDYTPTVDPKKADNGMAIILVNPQYLTDFALAAGQFYPFNDFRKFMGKDLEEVLVSRGYTIRGPYETYDEIIYSDKTETDLLLEIEVVVDDKYDNIEAHTTNLGSYGCSRKFSGLMTLTCRLNLVVKESLTREKLLVKSVSLPPTNITIPKTEKAYVCSAFNWSQMYALGEPSFVNPVSRALIDMYPRILTTAYNHLEPAELKALLPQVKELRAKKGY